jgi:hypothetical protein
MPTQTDPPPSISVINRPVVVEAFRINLSLPRSWRLGGWLDLGRQLRGVLSRSFDKGKLES